MSAFALLAQVGYRGYSAVGSGIAVFFIGHLAVLSIPFVLFLVALILCLRYRDPDWAALGQAQLVWIVVVVFVPCLGPILFLVMARPRLKAARAAHNVGAVMEASVPLQTAPPPVAPLAWATEPQVPAVPSGAPGGGTTVVIERLADEGPSPRPAVCGECGSKLRDGDLFCRTCGARTQT